MSSSEFATEFALYQIRVPIVTDYNNFLRFLMASFTKPLVNYPLKKI